MKNALALERRRLKGQTRQLVFACVLSLLASISAWPQKTPGAAERKESARTRDVVFRSASLARDMHYRVLLPAAYGPGGRFPALYLLHGLYGDYKNWDTLTRLETYSKDSSLIIVMPDADDSWYTNSATMPTDRFEDYIGKDLISEIDERFRTIRDGHARAIAGLSMGGYGAMKFALKEPQGFAFAGSLSGALNAAGELDRLRPEFRAKLLEVFGNEGSETRSQNDVFTLLKESRSSAYPYFYLACGTSDSFLTTNRAFVQQLSSRNLPYEYHEVPGGHTWEFWDRELPALLRAVDVSLATHQSSDVPLRK